MPQLSKNPRVYWFPWLARLTASVGLLATGCSPVETLEPRLEAAPRLSATQTADLQHAACDPGLQLAYVAGLGPGPCPGVANWAEAKLFAGAPAGDLQNFCEYTYTGPGPLTPADLDPHTTAHNADCDVVFPETASSPAEAYAPSLQAAFARAINLADADDLNLPETESLRSEVFVSVVDTVPSLKPLAPTSTHGLAMAAFVEDIACPLGSAACSVVAEHELGMPRLNDGTLDPDNGGIRGFQGELARALYRAATATGDRRVINISAGWETEIFGGHGHANRVPARAVTAVLEFARCEGKLPIAASGNRAPTCLDGPIMPAALAQRPAPSAARCAELGATGTVKSPSLHPLVYAVGGIDRHGDPPPSLERSAEPRLVAEARHATSTETGLPPLTGTSIPTAAVSGAAALVWSYAPELSPDEVMEDLYQAGPSLGRPADFAHEHATSDMVHRLDVCATLERVLDRTAPEKPLAELWSSLDCTASAASASDFSAEYEGTEDVTKTFGGEVSCEVSCAPGFARVASGVPGLPCPSPPPVTDFYVQPQPLHPPCPACTITTDEESDAAQVYAAIDDAYDDRTISDIQVTIHRGSSSSRLRLGAIPLESDKLKAIELGVTLDPSEVRGAEIAIMFAADEEATLPAVSGRNALILDWDEGDR